jgi:hypothetical protein
MTKGALANQAAATTPDQNFFIPRYSIISSNEL